MKTAVTLCAALIVGSFAACNFPLLSDSDSVEVPLATMRVSGPVHELLFSDSLEHGYRILVVNSRVYDDWARPATSPLPPPSFSGATISRWRPRDGAAFGGFEVDGSPTYLSPDGLAALNVVHEDGLYLMRVYDVHHGTLLREFPVDSGLFLIGVGKRAGEYIGITGFGPQPVQVKQWSVTWQIELSTVELPSLGYFYTLDEVNHAAPNGEMVLFMTGSTADFISGDVLGDALPGAPFAFSRDGRFVVGVATTGGVAVSDVHTLEQVRHFSADGVTAVAISDSGSFVAAALRDGTIGVWEVDTGERVRTVHTDEEFTNLTLSPEMRYIVAGQESGKICVWKVVP